MSFGIHLAAAHMIGDYVTQNDWMAANKLKDWRVRAVHVTVYSAGFLPIVFVAAMALKPAVLFVGLLWLTHFITDSRRWANGDKWPPKPILVDQSIHLATLAILASIFGLT